MGLSLFLCNGCLLLVLISSLNSVASSQDTQKSDKMMGGWTEQNASDPQHMERAWKAAMKINDQAANNGPYHVMPIKVLSAKSQVVAGVKWNFEVLYGETQCKKGDVSENEIKSSNADCKLKENPQRAIYKVVLWEKPWEDNFEQYSVEKVRNVEASETF